MTSRRRILVVGANGYIGRRVTQHLLSAGRQAVAVDNFSRSDSTRNAEFPILNAAYQELAPEFLSQFDDCLWLAGHSSVRQAKEDPRGALENNFYGLVCFRERYHGRLIYASSGSVYSRETPVECSETSHLATPSNVYDYSKIAFDLYLASQNISAVCLRLGTVNGPSERFRNELMLNRMVSDGLAHRTVMVSNPRAWRPVLAIEDLVRALDMLIDSECRSGVFNLCSVNLTIRAYAEAVARMTGATLRVLEDSPTYNFIMSSRKFSDTFGLSFTSDVDDIIASLARFLSTA
jgi:UDP-glucose 4-epimerase